MKMNKQGEQEQGNPKTKLMIELLVALADRFDRVFGEKATQEDIFEAEV
jgi:hypothetical protein